MLHNHLKYGNIPCILTEIEEEAGGGGGGGGRVAVAAVVAVVVVVVIVMIVVIVVIVVIVMSILCYNTIDNCKYKMYIYICIIFFDI